MFEHFGVKDIWVVVKSKKYLIVVLMALFTALFSFITYGKLKSLRGNPKEGQPLYASSLSYYVQPNMSDTNSEKTDKEFYRALPNDYVALLNTDACACYIYEGISNLYSKDYLKKNSELDVKNLNDLPLLQSIKKLYKIKRYNNTMIFNVYALAYNEELSKSILCLLQKYIEDNVEPRIKESNLELSGEAVKIITSSKELDEEETKEISNTTSNTKLIIKVLVRNTLIPLIGAMILLLFVLVLKAVLNPTLNRKSDFAEYDVPIIGEIKEN